MSVESNRIDSNGLDERLRKQALRVWLAGGMAMLLLPLSMAAAPALMSGGLESTSSVLYKIFSFMCHQDPDRSFHLSGHPLAVCARCFGVYSGLFVGFPVYAIFRRLHDIEPPSKLWLALATIPIGLDWTLGFFGIWDNTHLSRFITGMILGTVCSIYLVPAFVEIFRNRTVGHLYSRRAS